MHNVSAINRWFGQFGDDDFGQFLGLALGLVFTNFLITPPLIFLFFEPLESYCASSK